MPTRMARAPMAMTSAVEPDRPLSPVVVVGLTVVVAGGALVVVGSPEDWGTPGLIGLPVLGVLNGDWAAPAGLATPAPPSARTPTTIPGRTARPTTPSAPRSY